ncbi:MAG: PAS domain S-box protein [Thermoflexales bacterium]|nr:PAS domain S-box protein [Thermoflexales bacterium]
MFSPPSNLPSVAAWGKGLSSLCLAACLWLVLSPLAGAAAPARKAVLLVFPYQADLPQTVLIQQSIQAELGSVSDLTLGWYYEYIDLNRFPGEDYQQQVADLYAAKYGAKAIDLVFVVSEATLKFWLRHRAQILPDTPVVFCDITPERLAPIQLPADVTGISSVIDHTQLLTWVARARPAVTEIVVVQGVSESDRAFNTPLDVLEKDLGGAARLSDWSHLSLAEIKQRAAALPPSSILFYQLVLEDATGTAYRPIDVLRELVSVSAVPVISKYDHFIGTGTIGGYMYSLERVARETARLGARILRGEAAGDIPVAHFQSCRFIFDHLALQRYDIPLSALPVESTIKNQQYTVWERYRPQLIGLSLGTATLMLLAAYLGILTRRLGAARQALSQLNANLETQVQERTAALSQSNQRLETEIAERKRAAAQLQDYQGQLETQNMELLKLSLAIEQSGSTIVITDAEGAIQYANPRFEETSGYTRSEARGQNPRILKSGEQSTDYYRVLWETIASGQIWHGELHNRRKDGTLYWESATIAPIHDDGGQITHYIAIKEDITERVRSEAERRQAQEALSQYARQLAAQNAELDAFAHTVAHDLKNPIGLIIGYAALLGDYESMSPGDLSDSLRSIFQAGKKLDRIVEELMLLAGVRKQEITPEALDMGSVVRGAIDRLQLLLQDQQAQISVIDEAGWPAALGYAPWIEEVWANYISNAIKYGGNPELAEGHPQIQIGADPHPQEGGMVRFWVRDNGPGLSAESRSRLFTPFTRLEQVRAKGHGLGLSVVRRIVEKLGGQVGVESEIGQGSTFFFTLPVAPDQEPINPA